MKAPRLLFFLLAFSNVALAQNKLRNNTLPAIFEPDPLLLRPALPARIPHPREVALHPQHSQSIVSNICGIDVSHYQGNINWYAVASDSHASYAYLKCTENSSLTDNTFQRNLRGCRQAGIPVGAYHFFSPSTSPFAQLQNFITTLPSLRDCDLVPMIDVEARGRCSITVFRERLTQFLREVEKHYGVKPIIYTGVNFYKKYLDGYYDNYLFMLARYSEELPEMPPNMRVAIWQYSAHGHVAGIAGAVDLSRFVNGYTLKDITIKR